MKKINFVNKPNTDTPINDKNLNKMQDNIENAIEEKQTYTTEEKVVGTWIDDKPLYRKVIDVGSLPNSATIEVDTGLDSAVVRPIKMHGYAYNSTTGAFLILPYIIGSGGDIYLQYLTTNKFRIITSTDRTNLNAYVVLEYTKTTD